MSAAKPSWAPKPSVRIECEFAANGSTVWVFTGDLPDGYGGFGAVLPNVVELKRDRRRLRVEHREIAKLVWEWLDEHGVKVSADIAVRIGLTT